MCTAIDLTAGGKHLFGRNLDLEGSFGEGVTIMPRGYAFGYRAEGKRERGFAMIGMAIVVGGVPLFFDAVNECGLGMAGLNFPKNAAYGPRKVGKRNVAPFEFIPYVLGACATLSEARALLADVNLIDEAFGEGLPLTPLHWMIADKSGALVVEQTADGLSVCDDPVGVLTNNPPFPAQLEGLGAYRGVSPYDPPAEYWDSRDKTAYSRGIGAIGLPGDASSASRFARAAFGRGTCVAGDGALDGVTAFFHLLDSVSMVRGCVRLREGVYEETVYSSCCDTDEGIYYYTTYGNRAIRAVRLRAHDPDADKVLFFPLRKEQSVAFDD